MLFINKKTMSKKELRKYISKLQKKQLEEQIIDLYSRFKDVKKFYDFTFNPKEDKLVEECKFKISKEYFPVSNRKPKARRSVAQKYIRHFKLIGLDSRLIADIMLYNIEIAQSFSSEKKSINDSFFLSMFKSFEEAKKYINSNGINNDFQIRIKIIVEETWKQNWFNKIAFERIGEL